MCASYLHSGRGQNTGQYSQPIRDLSGTPQRLPFTSYPIQEAQPSRPVQTRAEMQGFGGSRDAPPVECSLKALHQRLSPFAEGTDATETAVFMTANLIHSLRGMFTMARLVNQQRSQSTAYYSSIENISRKMKDLSKRFRDQVVGLLDDTYRLLGENSYEGQRAVYELINHENLRLEREFYITELADLTNILMKGSGFTGSMRMTTKTGTFNGEGLGAAEREGDKYINLISNDASQGNVMLKVVLNQNKDQDHRKTLTSVQRIYTTNFQKTDQAENKSQPRNRNLAYLTRGKEEIDPDVKLSQQLKAKEALVAEISYKRSMNNRMASYKRHQKLVDGRLEINRKARGQRHSRR